MELWILEDNQATIKIQRHARGRATRMLFASIRAARGLVRFLGKNTERAIEDALIKAMTSAGSVQHSYIKLYLGCGLAVFAIALALAVVDRDPACPVVGLAVCILLLALQPADGERRIRACALTVALGLALLLPW